MTLQRHLEAESHCEGRPAKPSVVCSQIVDFDTSGNLHTSTSLHDPCQSRTYPTLLHVQRRSLQPNYQRVKSSSCDEDEGAEFSATSSPYRVAVMSVDSSSNGSASRTEHCPPRTATGSPIPSVLWAASTEPPITKNSLGELDLARIINDAKLRHDLNFEREVAFRPNYDGRRGEQKKALARLYWEALTIELTTYFQSVCRHNHTTSDAFMSYVTLAYFRGQQIPWRLPQMIRTVADILKTLVPEAEHLSVDRTLDVELVMQQLEKGVMDFVKLSQWLGILLKGSCSPQRDMCVSEMAEMIQDGIYHDNPRMLVGGIEKLFGVLEMMKLDVANHQIRNLKLLMVNDTVQFEQRVFLERIACGFDISQALYWYQVAVEDELQEYEEGHPRVEVFSRAVIDLIIENNSVLPVTFVFDFDRLRQLHLDLRKYMCQKMCGEALIDIAKQLGHSTALPPAIYQRFLQRISDIGEPCRHATGWSVQSERAALEVVRAAYALCNIERLPTEEHVSSTIRYLQRACSSSSDLYQALEARVCNELEEIVDHELAAISSLTPLQILNRYDSRSLLEPSHEDEGLRDIGQRIAHITTLHWWTWAPILYLQDRARADQPAPLDCQIEVDSETSSRTAPPRIESTEERTRECRVEGKITRTESTASFKLEDGELPSRGSCSE